MCCDLTGPAVIHTVALKLKLRFGLTFICIWNPCSYSSPRISHFVVMVTYFSVLNIDKEDAAPVSHELYRTSLPPISDEPRWGWEVCLTLFIFTVHLWPIRMKKRHSLNILYCIYNINILLNIVRLWNVSMCSTDRERRQWACANHLLQETGNA